MRCTDCKQEVPDSVRLCVVCGADLGFPNVRAASADAERLALTARYQAALHDADERKCDEILRDFEHAVHQARAVICRSWSIAHALVSSDSELYSTYHQMVRAELRLPTPNEFDIMRTAVDATLFPNYFDH